MVSPNPINLRTPFVAPKIPSTPNPVDVRNPGNLETTDAFSKTPAATTALANAAVPFEAPKTTANGGTAALENFEVVRPPDARDGGFGGLGMDVLTGPLAPTKDGLYAGLPKSAKHTFMQIAFRSGTMPKLVPGDKEASARNAEAWFNKYMPEEMAANGFQVLGLNGDKAFITSREDPEGGWVDWLVAMGGETQSGSCFAWQCETGSGAEAGGTGGQWAFGGELMGEGGWVNSLLDQQNNTSRPKNPFLTDQDRAAAEQADDQRQVFRNPFRPATSASADTELSNRAIAEGVYLSPGENGFSVRNFAA